MPRDCPPADRGSSLEAAEIVTSTSMRHDSDGAYHSESARSAAMAGGVLLAIPDLPMFRVLLLFLALGLPLAGCGRSGRTPAADPAASRSPVGLVLAGDAARHKAGIVRALEQIVQRPIVDLAEAPTPAGRSPRNRAKRPSRCAAADPTVTAAQRGVEAVYRVDFRYRSIDRPTTPEEQHGGLRGALGLAPKTVHEGVLTGRVTMTTFDGAIRTRTADLDVTQAGGVDVDDEVTVAISTLPFPPAPKWDGIARALLADGCTRAALQIVDARLANDPRGAAIRRSARAATDRPTAKSAKTPPDETEVTETTPTDAPAPEIEATTRHEEPKRDEPSCAALCTMHMVELCNNDRSLWSQNDARFEASACGVRRREVFLVDCYRRQWLTGTYHDACVRPCERSADGRNSLLHVLQSAGCLRADS